MTKRWATWLAVAVAAIFSILLTSASPASATAQQCAAFSATCNTTYGSGARVDKVVAIHDFPWRICNYGADVSVLDGRNHAHVKWFKHITVNSCVPLRAYITFTINRTFSCGDVTSVLFYSGSDPTGGYANVRLC
jgi:hypothetical protein